jgi:hypothetical protein
MRKLYLHLHLLLHPIVVIGHSDIRNLQHQEKYLEKNIKYRKLEKFSRSEKINFQEKVPYTVYREHR